MALGSAKLYFPNFVLKMVRSNLPPHQAVFHCPLNLNKFDIRSMLQKLYKVHVLDVRTSILLGKRTNPRPRIVASQKRGGKPSFKKAIVTFKQDFIFPDPPSLENGALKIPPQTGKGRNSANHWRHKVLEQNRERQSLSSDALDK